MAEEIIRYGAGGVPYVGRHTTEASVPQTEEVAPTEEEVAVTVTVTEKETPGDIPTGKIGSKQK